MNIKIIALGKIKDAGNSLSSSASSGKEAIARKYAAAKQKVSELAAKASRLAGEAKAIALRQLEKAKAVMHKLGQKLGQGKDYVVDKASAAKQKVFG